MESCVGLPCVVVRDLAGDVVSDVGLGDTMGKSLADCAHNPANDAWASHKVTVECAESTTGEGVCGCAVVGEQRIGVLEEGDHDEPATNQSQYLFEYVLKEVAYWLTQR